MAGWHDLPTELRLVIYDYVVAIVSCGRYKSANLATVCREWQGCFESLNFKSITIRHDDIAEFGRIIHKHERLDHLRYLRLHNNLPWYDCDDGDRPENAETIFTQELTFTTSLIDLLQILSAWQGGSLAGIAPSPGLTLELSASSPADSQHAFWERRLDPLHEDSKPLRSQNSFLCRCVSGRHPNGDTQFHRVAGGRPLRLRLVEAGISASTIPQTANIVTGLLTRRQFYRSISTSALSFLIRNCFPRLRSLSIERWQTARNDPDGHDAQYLEELLNCSLPRDLKSFNLFEDRSESHSATNGYRQMGRGAIGTALWRVCLMFPSLQHFSASTIIDARVFFSHFPKHFVETRPWRQLKTLCLTAECLTSDNFGTASASGMVLPSTWNMLATATKTAKLMPNLQVMELWHVGVGKACVWTYYKKENRARFAAQCDSWRYNSTASLVGLEFLAADWRELATELFHYSVSVSVEELPPKTYRDPCDIVPHLELAKHMLHPTSLTQMEWDRSENAARSLGVHHWEDAHLVNAHWGNTLWGGAQSVHSNASNGSDEYSE